MSQLWAVDTLGGYAYSDELSDVLRMNVQPMCKFRQFCDMQDATRKGLNAGENFHWNIYGDISSQGTSLTETSTVPMSNFTITQGTLTVNEFANGVPFTAKLDALSEHPVKAIIEKVLKHDAQKAFDIQAHAQFDQTLLRFVSETGTDGSGTLYTDGTATGTNNVALNNDHVKTIVDTMKERNIPPFFMDDYFCIAHPTTLRTFKNNLEDIHTYVGNDMGLTLIMNGECGRYEGVRFVEQTNITKANFTAGAFGQSASNGAFFFGSDTVGEAICIPEEMRGKIPTDFGRSKGIAWYALLGFGIVHGSTASQGRIVAWDSQA